MACNCWLLYFTTACSHQLELWSIDQNPWVHYVSVVSARWFCAIKHWRCNVATDAVVSSHIDRFWCDLTGLLSWARRPDCHRGLDVRSAHYVTDRTIRRSLRFQKPPPLRFLHFDYAITPICVKADTHYPCSRPVFTCSLAVNTSHEHERHIWQPCSRAVNTRCHFCHPCSRAPVHTTRVHGPCSRAVNTGSVYRRPWTRAVSKKALSCNVFFIV